MARGTQTRDRKIRKGWERRRGEMMVVRMEEGRSEERGSEGREGLSRRMAGNGRREC